MESSKHSNYNNLPQHVKKAKREVLLILLKNNQLPKSKRKNIDYHELEKKITAKLLNEAKSKGN